MKVSEVVRLLEFVRAVAPAQRIVPANPHDPNDLGTAGAWHKVLRHVDYADAEEAAVLVAQRQPFIAPADLIAECRRMRTTRVERADLTPVDEQGQPVDPDDVEAYLRAQRATIRRAAANPDAGRLALPAGVSRPVVSLAGWAAARRPVERGPEQQALPAAYDPSWVIDHEPDEEGTAADGSG